MPFPRIFPLLGLLAVALPLPAQEESIEKRFDGPVVFRSGDHFELIASAEPGGDEFLEVLENHLEQRLAGFFASHREGFDTQLEVSEFSSIPIRRIVVFPDLSTFRRFAQGRDPEIVSSHGFFDRTDQTCYIHRYERFLERSPFLDDFFGSFYLESEPEPGIDLSKNHLLSPRHLEAIELLGSDAVVKRSEHFLVAMQDSRRFSASIAAKKYLRVLEDLYRGFYGTFASDEIDLPRPARTMPMFIFRSREEYREYRHPEGQAKARLLVAEGHYEPDTGRLMSFKHDKGQNISTILHEGTHLLLNTLAGGPSKLFWFGEGIADLFGGYRQDAEGGYAVGSPPNTERLSYLKRIIEMDRKLPGSRMTITLKSLLAFSYWNRDRMLDNLSPQEERSVYMRLVAQYSQAWGFSHFMMFGGNPEYRRKYVAYVQRELDGEGGVPQVMLAFDMTDMELRRLERELFDYILALE